MVNSKLWLEVVRLRKANLSFAKISKLTGVSRQRAHQIVVQAKRYAGRKDDELARKLAALLKEEK